MNRVCGPAIVVRDAQVVDAGFDARHSALARAYRYSIVNTPVPNPFLAATAWHVADPLDLRLLRIASDPLIGEHDFTSFCRKPRVPEGVSFSMTRRVLDTRWHDLGDGVLRFDIEATAFCQQMVRSIVGTLVEVGLERRSPASVMARADRRRPCPRRPARPATGAVSLGGPVLAALRRRGSVAVRWRRGADILITLPPSVARLPGGSRWSRGDPGCTVADTLRPEAGR